jgi:hypothetical protein
MGALPWSIDGLVDEMIEKRDEKAAIRGSLGCPDRTKHAPQNSTIEYCTLSINTHRIPIACRNHKKCYQHLAAFSPPIQCRLC